jgi:multidrug transporter EmrE-like cation transporter
MKLVPFLLSLIDGHKTYASVILAIVSGLGMILTKNYSGGVTEIFQALTLVFGGASVVGLRHAVSKVPTGVLEAAGKHE